MKLRRRNSSRGLTTAETLVVSGLLGLFLFTVTSVVRFGTMLWHRTEARSDCKESLSRALSRMAPTFRSALRVDMTQSSAARVTVVLPRIDPATGRFAVPMEEGERVCFYLGDLEGTPLGTGTILWRSVDAVPDRPWALRGTRGAVSLDPGSLSFSYPSSTDPGSVTVQFRVSRTGGFSTSTLETSGEFFLRNRR